MAGVADLTGSILVLLITLLVHGGVCDVSCDGFCTADYVPVCASNYKTYSNNCTFMNAKCLKAPLEIVSIGKCPCPDNPVCTEEYFPQCGTDGITYGNECYFNVATSCKDTLGLAFQGECGCPTTRGCAAVFDPVCGSDCKTYSNECQLDIANDCRTDEDKLKVFYNRKCDDSCTSQAVVSNGSAWIVYMMMSMAVWMSF